MHLHHPHSLAWLSLLSITAVAAASVTPNADNTLRLPLLTHNHISQRHLLEQQSQSNRSLQSVKTKKQHIKSPYEPHKPKIMSSSSHDESLRINRHDPSHSRRHLQDDFLEVGGLYQGYGTHYVDLWVGTPPQRQTVIVDTGSGVTAFPCSGCQSCGSGYHASPFFFEKDSSSFQKLDCTQCQSRGTCSSRDKPGEYCSLHVSYQEGSSWSAYQAQDVTYLGGPHDNAVDVHDEDAENADGNPIQVVHSGVDPENAADYSFDMTFGCQTSITGLFKTQLVRSVTCIDMNSTFSLSLFHECFRFHSFTIIHICIDRRMVSWE